MLAAVAFAVLPVRIKELVYGNVQQGDDLVKGVQARMLAPVLKYMMERGYGLRSCARYSCVQPFASLLRLISRLMRGSQAVWCLGTFSYHPYIILHFGFDYENETQFYVLVVFYCPSARLPMLHGQGIITERKFENYTLITKIYDTLSLEVLLCKGF